MTIVGTHNTLRGSAGFHAIADVIGWQEVNTDADRAALVKALPAYDHWPVMKGDAPEPARSIPVSWRRDVFKLIGVDWTPTTPPRAGVTPQRGIVSVILSSVDGRRLAVVNTHFISKRRLSLWRRRMWNEHLAALAAVVRRHKADGCEVVVVGDMNRHQWLTLPGLTPATPSPAVQRVPYDQIHGVTDLTAVRGPAWGSDHPSWTTNLKEITVTKVQIYSGADHTTQWFADNFPGDRFDANCGVLHTTEGTDWPGYEGGATAPNLTAKPDIANKRLNWRQHFPIDMSSRALRNEAGGVETNTLNAAQVELIGTCDPRHRTSWNGQGKLLAGKHYIYWPDAPEWALADLADFLRWCNTEHGIPLTGAKTWLPYPKSYGSAAGNRFTFAAWRAFTGWCGHQHVPENTHGDPGDLDFARLLELAKPTATAPVAPKSTPRWDLIWETANEIVQAAPDDAGTELDDKDDVARKIRTLAARYSTKH